MSKDQTNEPMVMEPNLGINIEKHPSIKRSNKFFKYLIVFIFYFIGTFLCGAVIWYSGGRDYLLSVMDKTEGGSYKKNILYLQDELQKIQKECVRLQDKIENINSKVLMVETLKKNHEETVIALQNLQAKVSSLGQMQHKAEEIGKKETWQENLINAIKSGQSLNPFLHHEKIPLEIKKTLVDLDLTPSYKSILEEWGGIKGEIKFQTPRSKTLNHDSENLWGKFRAFLKDIFKVQHLNESNLTPEETFIRHVDKMLIEKNIVDLLNWLDAYKTRFDEDTKGILEPWVKKMQSFHKGQIIIETVKKY